MKKKKKTKAEWFDTHVEVLNFGSGKENKKLKALLKQKITDELLKQEGIA
jgi:hypothetical protein|tara:strand:- start:168 stop:317 length:150 start_codon:yes stop_codon:yes gene_type:complete